jgi:hypothetical protein
MVERVSESALTGRRIASSEARGDRGGSEAPVRASVGRIYAERTASTYGGLRQDRTLLEILGWTCNELNAL